MSKESLFGRNIAKLLGFDESRAMNSYVNDPESPVTKDDFRCDAERVGLNKKGKVSKSRHSRKK